MSAYSGKTKRTQVRRKRSTAPRKRKSKIRRRFYETLDNGGRPFRVVVSGKNVTAYKNFGNQKKLFELHNADKVFIGSDPPGFYYNQTNKNQDHGNSILVKKGSKYIYIGESIKEFQTADTIKKYVSPIGNSAVPYPFAIGKNYTYLMAENKAIPTELLSLSKKRDPYEILYFPAGKTIPVVDLPTKTLVKRLL